MKIVYIFEAWIINLLYIAYVSIFQGALTTWAKCLIYFYKLQAYIICSSQNLYLHYIVPSDSHWTFQIFWILSQSSHKLYLIIRSSQLHDEDTQFFL